MKNNRCRDAKVSLLRRSRVCLFCSYLFIFVLNGNPARAENLPDPTRPPAELGAPAIAVVHSGPVLQSVLISPERKTAIISGETISLGGQYRKGRVVKISESEVVLNNGGNLQTLRLFPEVEKKTSYPGPVTEKKARRAGLKYGKE